MCICITTSAILRTKQNVTPTATPTPRMGFQNLKVLRPVGRSPVIDGVPLPVRAGAPGGRPPPKEAAGRLLAMPLGARPFWMSRALFGIITTRQAARLFPLGGPPPRQRRKCKEPVRAAVLRPFTFSRYSDAGPSGRFLRSITLAGHIGRSRSGLYFSSGRRYSVTTPDVIE
jgi:hypothetical protein